MLSGGSIGRVGGGSLSALCCQGHSLLVWGGGVRYPLYAIRGIHCYSVGGGSLSALCYQGHSLLVWEGVHYPHFAFRGSSLVGWEKYSTVFVNYLSGFYT